MMISIDDLYNIGETYLADGIYPSKQYFSRYNGVDQIVDEICERISRHNSLSYCHPVDSLVQVLQSVQAVPEDDPNRDAAIDDYELSGYMLNTVLVVLPLIAYHMNNGEGYYDTIEILYENGTMDFFAKAGRHLASEDPDSATDSLLQNFNM